MPAKKASKNTKRLKKSKKLEATKPLTVMSSGGGNDKPSESVSFTFDQVQVK